MDASIGNIVIYVIRDPTQATMSTRLVGRFIVIAAALPRPGLLTQHRAPQHGAVVRLELEQHDRALATGHQLPAGGFERAHHGAEHRSGRAWVTGPIRARDASRVPHRSEEHTSELQSQSNLVCRLLLEKKKQATGYLVTPTLTSR